MLAGVFWYIVIESLTHSSISISGKSENRRMHSLKPDINKESLNCFNIAKPTKRGNDESPSNNLSHRCNILCSGNTSKILIILSIDD